MTGTAVGRLLRPSSVVIVGMSARPGSTGHIVLSNLRRSGFTGAIHLVGREVGTIEGLPVVSSLQHVPIGVDLAILCVPADGVEAAVHSCVERGIGGAVCFASGFAETGERGRAAQIETAAVATAGGLALLGPNCVGFTNFADGVDVLLVPNAGVIGFGELEAPGVAILAQSGGIGTMLADALAVRGIPLSYMITTGNEAQMTLPRIIEHLLADDRTSTIAVYAEQVRGAQELLRVSRAAEAVGKRIVLFHPGRSATAQHAAGSHTGAMVGDHAAMRTAVEASGILLADTYEQLLDLTVLAHRFDRPQAEGLGVVTASGAICVIAGDYAEACGMDIPQLSSESRAALAAVLPAYTPPRNPLDVGTTIVARPELLQYGTEQMVRDPRIGGVLVSLPHQRGPLAVAWVEAVVAATKGSATPVVYVDQSDGVPLASEVAEIAEASHVVGMQSAERAIRALAAFTRWGARGPTVAATAALGNSQQDLPPGAQPEWRSKELLAAIGIATPAGALARDVESAVSVAETVGYPVVLKIQSAQLPHKTEVGGVLLGILDAEAVRDGWHGLLDKARRAAPDAVIDGVLVEQMAPRDGVELIVGLRRDPEWGPILAVGLGGIWAEALRDVRLMAADTPVERITAELRELRGARMLEGYRGGPAVSVRAVAEIAAAVGRLALEVPAIVEVDVNPVVAYAERAVALDALVVTA